MKRLHDQLASLVIMLKNSLGRAMEIDVEALGQKSVEYLTQK